MTSARERLAKWIGREGLSQREAARILGLHFTVLNKLLTGVRNPRLQVAITIQDRTGIPAAAWKTSTDGKLRSRAVSRSNKAIVANA